MTAKPFSVAALAGALALAWLFAPWSAFAQSDGAVAAELFAEGRDLVKAGSYAEAKEKFAESARLDPRVGTFANMAMCDERLGRLAAARADWQQVLDLARSRGDERLAAVEKQFTRVDALVPRLEIRAPAPLPAGFTVTVDGVRAAELSSPLPIDPGAHLIVATAPGRQTWTTTVEAPADGGARTLAIPELEADSDAAAEPRHSVAPTPLPEPLERSPGKVDVASRRTLVAPTVALFTVGLAAVTTGAVFGSMAFGEKSAAESACGPSYPVCDRQTQSTVDGHQANGHAYATVATIAFVAGAASLAGSGVLFFLGRSKAHDRAELRMAPAVGPGTAGLAVAGAW